MDDLDLALRQVEASLTGDERMYEEMSPANRDAVCFPICLLLAANNALGETDIPLFSQLAKIVGQTKGRYNDPFVARPDFLGVPDCGAVVVTRYAATGKSRRR
jgi:hypothetical protein